jgi:hypothetical protein
MLLLVRALRSEEKVVGSIRHEGLVAHVGRHKASGSWSGSAVGVKALDESAAMTVQEAPVFVGRQT